jgi:hypothetical protein
LSLFKIYTAYKNTKQGSAPLLSSWPWFSSNPPPWLYRRSAHFTPNVSWNNLMRLKTAQRLFWTWSGGVIYTETETQKLKIYQHHKRDFQISKNQNIVSLKLQGYNILILEIWTWNPKRMTIRTNFYIKYQKLLKSKKRPDDAYIYSQLTLKSYQINAQEAYLAKLQIIHPHRPLPNLSFKLRTAAFFTINYSCTS